MAESLTPIRPSAIGGLLSHLVELYAQRADACLEKIIQLAEHYAPLLPSGPARRWDQRDVVLITYADQVRVPGQPPLRTLRKFLLDNHLDQLISGVHLLPFYPFSSDDGFSVIDYRTVDPTLGDWDDVRQLGSRFDLMFDLVINHVSQRSRWFQDYLAGKPPRTRYFIEVSPAADLTGVTRPRSSALLTEFQTNRGPRHVWTTFSADQIDLNYTEPDVLVEMIDILLFYISQGARIIRLDAVAYLWKQLGTSCIHLAQTHTIVKLLRRLIDELAPGVLLLSETNVPHEENVSYFGAGDEAQMVYQFSLPPLLLDAMLSEDARPLSRWLTRLDTAPPGTTYFNFTASHDGIGVRPLEGLVSNERIARLGDAARERGGRVSTKTNSDGTTAPYELNISYLDALGEPTGMDPPLHARRFLASQALMLALRGIPGIYFHSLVGTANDYAGMEATGQPRSINRRKYELNELMHALADSNSTQAHVFDGYRHLLKVRIAQPAFHPDAPQQAWPVEPPSMLAFLRTSLDERQRILVVANLAGKAQQVNLAQHRKLRISRDLLASQPISPGGPLHLDACQVAWLEVDLL